MSGSLARRGLTIARRMSNPSARLPRRGYAHCFIEEHGVHSRLHLHHFYSLFLPDVREPVTARIQVYDAAGKRLGAVARTLQPFTSLTLPVADVLSELRSTAGLGTVAVDIDPADSYAQKLVEVGPPNAMAQSPFWMGYYDDRGSVAYIHSIDQYYGAVFGIGRLAGLAYRARWQRGGGWTSKRLIETEGMRSADAYLVNHSPSAGRTTLRWLTYPEGIVLSERTATVAAHGATRVSVTADDVSRAGNGAGSVRLEVDELLTGNGKPYVMVRYRDGPFSLHHG